MTDQTPVERAAAAIDENYNPDQAPILAAMFQDYARAVFDSIDVKELSHLLDDHKYSYYDDYSGHAVCECGWGEPEHSDHLAQAVKNWLTGKD